VIEWDFPELHHIIVCEKFVRFAHCLCMSHFCKSAGWQQHSSSNTVFTTTQCPDSKRDTLLYICEEFSSLKPILLLCNNNKKVFECCLESSRCVYVSNFPPDFYGIHNSLFHFTTLISGTCFFLGRYAMV
jgi:hypothetical protein